MDTARALRSIRCIRFPSNLRLTVGCGVPNLWFVWFVLLFLPQQWTRSFPLACLGFFVGSHPLFLDVSMGILSSKCVCGWSDGRMARIRTVGVCDGMHRLGGGSMETGMFDGWVRNDWEPTIQWRSISNGNQLDQGEPYEMDRTHRMDGRDLHGQSGGK